MRNKWTLAILTSLFGISAFSGQRQPNPLEWPLNTPKRKRLNPVNSFNPQKKAEKKAEKFLEEAEEQYAAYRQWLPGLKEEGKVRAFLAGYKKEKKDEISLSPASRKLFGTLS